MARMQSAVSCNQLMQFVVTSWCGHTRSRLELHQIASLRCAHNASVRTEIGRPGLSTLISRSAEASIATRSLDRILVQDAFIQWHCYVDVAREGRLTDSLQLSLAKMREFTQELRLLRKTISEWQGIVLANAQPRPLAAIETSTTLQRASQSQSRKELAVVHSLKRVLCRVVAEWQRLLLDRAQPRLLAAMTQARYLHSLMNDVFGGWQAVVLNCKGQVRPSSPHGSESSLTGVESCQQSSSGMWSPASSGSVGTPRGWNAITLDKQRADSPQGTQLPELCWVRDHRGWHQTTHI